MQKMNPVYEAIVQLLKSDMCDIDYSNGRYTFNDTKVKKSLPSRFRLKKKTLNAVFCDLEKIGVIRRTKGKSIFL